MPVTESPHSVETVDTPTDVNVRLFPFGEVHEAIGQNVNVFTIVEQDKQLEETGRKVVVINSDPEGDEAWILSQDPSQHNVADRIRFIQGGQIEFTHCNGTNPALQALYSEDGGRINYQSSTLLPDVEVTVPPEISPQAISDIKDTFVALKIGMHNGYSFTQIQNFADSGVLLGIFQPLQTS